MPDAASPGTDSLADKAFWEQEYYWSGLEPPVRPDLDFSFDRCAVAALEWIAPVEPGASVIEIGCAPAKWLVFYGERFGARLEGIEYSEQGAELSRRNLEACGLAGDIRHADFFDCDPSRNALVLSMGFIEHFEDLEGVFARHLDFLAPGGRLLIGVPNFRGLNRVLQQWSDPAYLALHNRRAMDPALYARLAAQHGLELESTEYIGGFDPAIIKLGRASAKPFVAVEHGYRRLPVADRINHRWGSSYLMASFRSPGGAEAAGPPSSSS